MTPPRFPFWTTLNLVVQALCASFYVLHIMALLWVGKPIMLFNMACMALLLLLLVHSALDFDRYTFAREHLMAENKLAREWRALKACAEVIHDRIDRGVLVYGTPLHTAALVRKRRVMEALRVAQVFRDKRDGVA